MPTFRIKSLLSLMTIALLLPGCRQEPPSAPVSAPAKSHIRIEPSKPVKGKPGVMESQEGATAEEVGFIFYPGAQINRSTVMRDKRRLTTGAELETKEPYAQVVKFYRDTYATRKPRTRTQDADPGQLTTLNWQDAQGNYTVAIRQDPQGRRTVITLARTHTIL